jgi:hypothetical protein
MFHDRGQRHGERLRQRADRKARLLGEPRQQGSPRRIGQRGKRTIERSAVILYHVVKYRTGLAAVKQAGFSAHTREMTNLLTIRSDAGRWLTRVNLGNGRVSMSL